MYLLIIFIQFPFCSPPPLVTTNLRAVFFPPCSNCTKWAFSSICQIKFNPNSRRSYHLFRAFTQLTLKLEPTLFSKASLYLCSKFLFPGLHILSVLLNKISSSWVPSLTVKLFSLRVHSQFVPFFPQIFSSKEPNFSAPFQGLVCLSDLLKLTSYAMGRPEFPTYIKFRTVKTLLLYFNT